jgi:hypothetical protein
MPHKAFLIRLSSTQQGEKSRFEEFGNILCILIRANPLTWSTKIIGEEMKNTAPAHFSEFLSLC